MIVRVGVLRRRPDMDTDSFRRHWRETHGPLAARLPGLRRYEQNLVIDRSQLAIDHARGGWDVDGFSQLWFDDVEAMRASTATSEFAATVPDIERFIGDIKLVVCQPNVVVPLAPNAGSLIKRMSILRRRPDIDAARFREEWFGFHAEAVARFPGIAGYTQNLVLERGADLFKPAPYEQVPIDGIVELWFPDKATLEAAFHSPAADVSQRHALDFIAEITTFLVERHKVI
jgi:uncharacterized protein (TIGR02118 family)